MNYRIERLGKIKKTVQGLSAKVLKYYNRDNILVEILETRQQIWTDWWSFNKGEIIADLEKYPAHTDCTFNQAKFYVISITMLLFALAIGGLIYKII